MTQIRAEDGRWKGAAPELAPKDVKTVSRVVAARLAGVDPRTISRWAANGVLVKYRGPRGDVQFAEEAVRALRKEPEDRQARADPEPESGTLDLPDVLPLPRPRW